MLKFELYPYVIMRIEFSTPVINYLFLRMFSYLGQNAASIWMSYCIGQWFCYEEMIKKHLSWIHSVFFSCLCLYVIDKIGKRKSGATDFDALRRHGYKGGLSVLSVPQPKDAVKEDWTWSTGDKHREMKDVEETYQDRQKTRAALSDGELLANVQTSKEKKNISFSQKEKRKRDLGQASRGKSYVEEEKRLLRESGIYSSFDTWVNS